MLHEAREMSLSQNRKVLNRFIDFLCQTWPSLEQLIAEDEIGSFLDDWTQANWELLVEGSIVCPNAEAPIYLSIYRHGSDSAPNSSRVFLPEAIANHAIFCIPKTGSTVEELISGEMISPEQPGFQLSHFVAFRDGWYFEEPPFDCVLIEEQDYETPLHRVIRTADIDFVVAPYGGD